MQKHPWPPEEPTGFAHDVRVWSRRRVWWWYLPLWLALAYVGYYQYLTPASYNCFSGLDLAIHEGGHILFRPFGLDLWVAGGTIAQLAAPLIAMYILLQQPDYFGIPLCLGWLSSSVMDMAIYMGDARAMALTLVTEGGAPIDPRVLHDWHYLFNRMGVLPHDQQISHAAIAFGNALMVASLVIGLWLMWEMARAKES